MKTALFFMAHILALGMASAALAGPRVGNGGDADAFDFLSIARADQDILKKGIGPANLIDPLSYEKAIDTTTVEFTFDVLKDGNGIEKDALNYPSDHEIDVNRVHWSVLSLTQREILVLHEYLGILGIPDNQYATSSGSLGLNFSPSGLVSTDPYASVSSYNYYDEPIFQSQTISCAPTADGRPSFDRIEVDVAAKSMTVYAHTGAIERYWITTFDQNNIQGSKVALNIVAVLNPQTSVNASASDAYTNGKAQIISTEALPSASSGKWSAVYRSLTNTKLSGSGDNAVLGCTSQ